MDPLSNMSGPMTRSRTKMMQSALNSLIVEIQEAEMQNSTLREFSTINLLQVMS